MPRDPHSTLTQFRAAYVQATGERYCMGCTRWRSLKLFAKATDRCCTECTARKTARRKDGVTN